MEQRRMVLEKRTGWFVGRKIEVKAIG